MFVVVVCEMEQYFVAIAEDINLIQTVLHMRIPRTTRQEPLEIEVSAVKLMYAMKCKITPRWNHHFGYREQNSMNWSKF